MNRKISRFILSACLACAIIIGIAGTGNKAHAQGEPFIGQFVYVAFSFAPKGWTACDGQLLSVSQNTAPFSLLGQTYGGDERSTFGIPDMGGRVPIHQGQGKGLNRYIIGMMGGYESYRMTLNELAAHKHVVTATSVSNSVSTASGGGGGGTTVNVDGTAAVTADLYGTTAEGNINVPTGMALAKGNATVARESGSANIYNTTAPDQKMKSGSVKIGNLSGLTVTIPAGGSVVNITTNTTTATTVVVQETGASQGLPLMQPFLTVNCIISLEGMYPPRN